MQQNHNGFSLIELLIATAIAALLSGFVFGLVRQMSKATGIVDSSVDIYLKAALVQRVLEKDLSGACVPFTALQQEEESNKKQQEQKPATSPAPGAPKTQLPQPSNKEQKKAPEITKLFYAVKQDKFIDLITFITNNPLQTYANVSGDAPKPRLARVVYRLKKKESPGEHQAYTLMRQESYELDFEKFKEGGDVAQYEVIDNISSLECSFILLEENEQKDGKKKLELVESDDWDHEKKQREKKENPDERRVPHAVAVTIEIGDTRMKEMRTFDFIVPILPDFMTKVPHVESEQPISALPTPAQKPPGTVKAGNPFAGTGLQVPNTLQPKSWNQSVLPAMPKR